MDSCCWLENFYQANPVISLQELTKASTSVGVIQMSRFPRKISKIKFE